ncbi:MULTISPECIES: 16S rRNA (uracil(1498)-N(3))-methyltransferase [unclassified Legionella]|uniref:16S rRNA (uracil(1498)-N(3))-methyltransferase n=1 Tax=unclassified Legionella TaxID=2622702 RepID=UPI0010547494|nr:MULTISPECIES: 16S rRNA (uracil(1498)-N(3))-methyltransferase [unclassified Legionella]MDI9818022.1 16S rRNA (uracil(1498)-N(3))-methyltransferase [Legionella sp. PL877]
MREIRIYQPGEYHCGQQLELSAAASQHVGIVLRMQPGQQITLFPGDNREFEAIISSVHKKKVTVAIISERSVDRESPRGIHLVQAVSKGERMEIVVQKAVELGVASITPLLTARSVVKLDAGRMEKKRGQWQAIAVAACEQSGRNQVPEIKPVCHLDNYLKQNHPSFKLVLHPEMAQTWRNYELAENEITLLIGPEGGFSDEEIKQILSFDFKPLRLGPRILRTETAAISALSVLQAVWGDL